MYLLEKAMASSVKQSQASTSVSSPGKFFLCVLQHSYLYCTLLQNKIKMLFSLTSLKIILFQLP